MHYNRGKGEQGNRDRGKGEKGKRGKGKGEKPGEWESK
jgi:hypothetical protein